MSVSNNILHDFPSRNIDKHQHHKAGSCDRGGDQVHAAAYIFSQGLRRLSKEEESSVCGGEVEMVLRSLGLIHCQDQKQQLPARVDAFEERNPSLDEVREAFDENRGERELHTVMCALGFKEGFQIQNCRKMIVGVDQDADAKIYFHDFLQFMEENTFI